MQTQPNSLHIHWWYMYITYTASCNAHIHHPSVPTFTIHQCPHAASVSAHTHHPPVHSCTTIQGREIGVTCHWCLEMNAFCFFCFAKLENLFTLSRIALPVCLLHSSTLRDKSFPPTPLQAQCSSALLLATTGNALAVHRHQQQQQATR